VTLMEMLTVVLVALAAGTLVATVVIARKKK
jgi:hypothetical protein